MRLPEGVLAMSGRGPDWATWVDGLPRLLDALVEEWGLTVDGQPTHGFCAVVVPVRTPAGAPAVLKVSWPHGEAEHEHLALQHWHGRGAARLLRADPRRFALLLERLHQETLNDLWDVEACEVVAGLYADLHVPSLPQLRSLPAHVARRTDALAALPRDAALPRRLVEQAVSLGRELADDPASRGTMIHTDLHYDNVLAADRAPWLAIDPKPLDGDPHYELAPMLWNRFAELTGGPVSLRNGVRQRFHTLVDAAGLDEDRARAWVVVRMLHLAADGLDDADESRLTMCVAIAKAVQD